jgi:hypothetical protein
MEESERILKWKWASVMIRGPLGLNYKTMFA